MSYICKDCKHNNNGWCKHHKHQGLKNITSCSDCTTQFVEIKVEALQNKPTSPELDTEYLKEQMRVVGKVEALTFLMQAMEYAKNDSVEEQLEGLKNLVLGLALSTSASASLMHVKSIIDSEVDMDMINAFQHYIDEKNPLLKRKL